MKRFLLLGVVVVSAVVPLTFGACGSDTAPPDAGIDTGKEVFIPPPPDVGLPSDAPVPVTLDMQVFERTSSGQVIVAVEVCVFNHPEIVCGITNSNGRVTMSVPRAELMFGFKKDPYAPFAYAVDTRSLPPGLFVVVMATQAQLSAALGNAYDINGAHVFAYMANVNIKPGFNIAIDPAGGSSTLMLGNINMKGYTAVTAGPVKASFTIIPSEAGVIDSGSGTDAGVSDGAVADADDAEPPEADPPDAGTCGPPKAGAVGWDENMQPYEIRGEAISGYATIFNVVCQ